MCMSLKVSIKALFKPLKVSIKALFKPRARRGDVSTSHTAAFPFFLWLRRVLREQSKAHCLQRTHHCTHTHTTKSHTASSFRCKPLGTTTSEAVDGSYAGVCWRMLTYADVCWRMLTHTLQLHAAASRWELLYPKRDLINSPRTHWNLQLEPAHRLQGKKKVKNACVRVHLCHCLHKTLY